MLQGTLFFSPEGFAYKTRAIMSNPTYQGDIIMARSKPYTGGLFVLDLILTLCTGGFWLLIVLFRELMRRN